MSNYVIYDSDSRKKELFRTKYLRQSTDGHKTAEDAFQLLVQLYPSAILVEENYGEKVLMRGTDIPKSDAS